MLLIAVMPDQALATSCLDNTLPVPAGPYLDQLCGQDKANCADQRQLTYYPSQDFLFLHADSPQGLLWTPRPIIVNQTCQWQREGFSLHMDYKSSPLGRYFDRADRVLALNTQGWRGATLKIGFNYSERHLLPQYQHWLLDDRHSYMASCVHVVYDPVNDVLETQCEMTESVNRGNMLQLFEHRLLPRVRLYKGLLQGQDWLVNNNGQVSANTDDINDLYRERVINICEQADLKTREIGGQLFCHSWEENKPAPEIEGCKLEEFAYDKPVDILAIQCQGHKAHYFMKGASYCLHNGHGLALADPYKHTHYVENHHFDKRRQSLRLTCIASQPSMRYKPEL